MKWEVREMSGEKPSKVDTSIKKKKAELAAGKPPMDLLAFDVLEAVSWVMASGIEDHGKRGWETGVVWMDYTAAAMRHLTSWVLKRGLDSKSGESHLDHAIACLMILSASEKRKLGKDDR